jgi:hypothetical protein
MDTKIFLKAALAGLFASTPAMAGGMSTGGGSASVCRETRDGRNEIRTGEMLDILEGAWRLKIKIRDIPVPPHEQVLSAIQRLAGEPALMAFVRQTYEDIAARKILLNPMIGLHTSHDLGTDQAVYILAGCPLEQVGYYEADGRLRIARSVFDFLSPTNQAAFFLHETLYRLTRTVRNATDSAGTRQLVAKLLSNSLTDEQVTTAVRTALFEEGRNAFIPLRKIADANIRVHVKNDRPVPRTVSTYDIQGRMLETKQFWGRDSTIELEADNVARLDFGTETTEHQLMQVFYGDQLVFEKEFLRLHDGFDVYVGWQH